MKKVLLTLVTLLCTYCAMIAAPKEHTIERGETLESIARQYGVSKEALLEANPSARDMVFAGMVLTIPEGEPIEESNSSTLHNNRSYTPNDYPESRLSKNSQTDNAEVNENSSESRSVENPEIDIQSFSGMFACYSASFKSFEHGYYGLEWHIFFPGGIGANFSMNANFGLGSGDWWWKFGPMYGYKVTDWLAVEASLRGFVQTYDKVEFDLKTGKPTTKGAATGGITLTPGLVFRLGRLQLGFGYEFGWLHGASGLCHNAEFIIGFNY